MLDQYNLHKPGRLEGITDTIRALPEGTNVLGIGPHTEISAVVQHTWRIQVSRITVAALTTIFGQPINAYPYGHVGKVYLHYLFQGMVSEVVVMRILHAKVDPETFEVTPL